MASDTRTIYTGITNDLESRVLQHKSSDTEGFTKKYGVHKLVYYEEFDDVYSAIEREKQIKSWRRAKKIDLVNSINPKWEDLTTD